MLANAPSILVVDDEPDYCATLRDILVDLKYDVDTAYDGPAALEMVKQKYYDVALLDLRMPGMDGVELYRRIRELRPGTVAIIVTAYASSSTAHVALAAGAWRIVSKPVDVFLLEGLISQALDQPLILVVVDDVDVCRTLWELLREHGYRVCLANNLSQVQDNLASCRYRVVLIDLKLPDQDGTEVFRVVREENPEARTIVTTSHPAEMELQIKNVVAAGADAVCYKPFDVDQLLTTIERLVR